MCGVCQKQAYTVRFSERIQCDAQEMAKHFNLFLLLISSYKYTWIKMYKRHATRI